ncbi:MAG: hypothetical protein Q9181_000674 [Wetmoreana brouardii]
MTSNDPSRRASVASSSDLSLVDHSATGKSLPKKDKPSGTIKLKKAIVKNTKSKDDGKPAYASSTVGDYGLIWLQDSKTGSRSPSPDTQSVNDNDTDPRASIPASQTGEEITQKVRCKHCKNPIPKSAMASHLKLCPEKKTKEKAPKKKETKDGPAKPTASNEDGDGPGEDSPVAKANGGEAGTGAEGISSAKGVIKSAKKSAAKETAATNGDSKKSKKRKADIEGDKEPKKKKLKKDEPPKPKVPKPKGPVDVEKQCGVLLPNGGYCARSLTCKSHSMGAKRAVPGRSLPYDMLLAQYQKKNQAKQQKAAMDANAPLVDDEADANAPIDSDEEKDAVMAAIARSRPQPLAQHIHISLRKKHEHIRIKEALSQALTGNRGGNLFATRPPEASASGSGANQGGLRGITAGIVEGGNVVQSPVGIGMGGGTGAAAGGQGEVGAGGGGGPGSLIQQALGTANVNANTAAATAAGGGTTATASGTGAQSRKSSIAAPGT